MLLLMTLLLSEPSLDWLRLRSRESSSLRIETADPTVIVLSTPLDWAMLASLNPVSAISRLSSTAMSGECDLTLVCSQFALAVEMSKITMKVFGWEVGQDVHISANESWGGDLSQNNEWILDKDSKDGWWLPPATSYCGSEANPGQSIRSNQRQEPPKISEQLWLSILYLQSFLACPGSMLDDRERLFWPTTLDMSLGSAFWAKCCILFVYASIFLKM